jgi:hypothetical protein
MGVVAIVGLLLIAPIDYPGRLLGVVFDYGHVPAFAVLVFVVSRLLSGQNTSIKVAGTVAIAATAFGVGGEFVQQYVGRSAEPGDAFANAVGAAIGFFVATWNKWTQNQRRVWMPLLVLAVIGAVWAPTLILIDINRQRTDFPMLGSFESKLELSRWHTRNSSKRRSQSYSSDGEWCLEWKLRPAKYPQIHTRWPFGDWSRFASLEVDIWNEDEPIEVVVKIEDTDHNGSHDDRYQQSFRLLTGKTTISIQTNDIQSAIADRKMDLQRIARLSIFTIDLQKRRTLYIDRLQLTDPR